VTARGVTDLLIRDLTFLDSPNHNLELFASPMEVVNVTIRAPDVVSHNTDGIDVHGNGAYLHNLTISVGDDHVAFHANDSLVEDCVFGTGHGASVGSLGAGTYLKNITVRRASFDGAVTAARIKATPTSSGSLVDVAYEDLTLNDVGTSVLITMDYTDGSGGDGAATEEEGGSSSSLRISNVTFSRIAANGTRTAVGSLLCDAGSPCTGLTVRDVTHTALGPKAKGWSCAAAHGVVAGTVTPPLTCLLP
jgi:polygalacturonase